MCSSDLRLLPCTGARNRRLSDRPTAVSSAYSCPFRGRFPEKGHKREPHVSPAKRVPWGEEEQRDERAFGHRPDARDMELAMTKGPSVPFGKTAPVLICSITYTAWYGLRPFDTTSLIRRHIHCMVISSCVCCWAVYSRTNSCALRIRYPLSSLASIYPEVSRRSSA